MLQPAVVASLGTLVLNDHVLKGRWPGWLTGKASDVAGLYAFPLVVVAGAEVARWMWRSRRLAGHDGEATSAAGRPTSRRDRGAVTIHHGIDARSRDAVDRLPAGRCGAAGADRWAVSARWSGAAIATVAAGFTSIKVAQPAGDLYQAGLGALRWLPGAMLDILSGSEPGAPGRAALVRDPTDLVALVALWPAWRTARRRTAAHTVPRLRTA